jgi:hypothetical protein
MLKQKKSYIPTVANVPVTEWNAATDFTSDAIEFPETTPWGLDVEGYAGVTAGSPVLNILASNTEAGEYKPYKTVATSIDMTVAGNRVIFDEIFSPRFMKISYVSGGSTGDFSLVLSK